MSRLPLLPAEARLFACLGLLISTISAQVNVTTQHNDTARTGQNLAETVLNPGNVTASGFGLLAGIPVDGQVYAQPLILSNVSIGGGTHNAVFIATEHDSVYAFDAVTGAAYWKTSFINPNAGVTTVSTSQVFSCTDISPEYGITSTPVINPSTGVLYAVANTSENGAIYYRLHALNVHNGAELTGFPILIRDPAGLLNPQYQNQRTGLLLNGNHLTFGFSSHCDHSNWYGLVFTYNISTLALENVYTSVPSSNGGKGGVWMGEAGIAADASGNFYFSTGNGNFDGGTSFGDSIVKINPAASFAQVDYYTPGNQSFLNQTNQDLDVGSGGVLLLPDLPSGTPHYQRLAQAGKEGKISIVDRNSMGHYCCAPNGPDTNIVQEISGQISGGMFGSPTYWGGTGAGPGEIYFSGSGDAVKAFSFNLTTGAVSTTPVAQTYFACGGAAHQSCLTSASSNGFNNGILWALDSGTGILYALSPTNLTVIYSSSQVPGRDSLNGGVKFLAPTVANGKVYIGSNNEFGIYGLYGVSVSSTSLDFGSFANSSSFPKTMSVVVTNQSNSNVTIGVPSVPNSSSSKTPNLFYVSAQTCGAIFVPGGSCTVSVTFETHSAESTNSGSNTATLLIPITDKLGSSNQGVALSATMTCSPSTCQK